MTRNNSLSSSNPSWKFTLVAVLLFVSANLAAQQYKVLYHFKGAPQAAVPMGSLIQDRYGNLYGTTAQGGEKSQGTAFMLTRANHEVILHSFNNDPPGSDGCFPASGLTPDGLGNLYGTAVGCGPFDYAGILFKIDRFGNYSILLNFGGAIGGNPEGRVLRDSEGNLYGTTTSGGDAQNCGESGCGTVYKVDASGRAMPLHMFDGMRGGFGGWWPGPVAVGDGESAYGDLLRDAEGNLYGTTWEGGIPDRNNIFGYGTVFKLSASGQETLYRFPAGGAEGAYPMAGLVRDASRNFYGTTSAGGTYKDGVIFKLSPAGTLTILHNFTGPEGWGPESGLTWGPDGNLYGTATYGGTYGLGVVYKLSMSGDFTILHSFAGGSDGAYPCASLYRGKGNILYGTTAGVQQRYGQSCNQNNCGTIFAIRP